MNENGMISSSYVIDVTSNSMEEVKHVLKKYQNEATFLLSIRSLSLHGETCDACQLLVLLNESKKLVLLLMQQKHTLFN